MSNATAKPRATQDRVFLFLQGPHGPFFSELSERLTRMGMRCWRVAFNAGDAAAAHDKDRLLSFKAPLAEWPDQFVQWLTETGATDLVLYGDTREHHAAAVRIARQRNMTVHVFEEGYIRPFWATYERNGSNGNSRLMDISLEEMTQALSDPIAQAVTPPDKWGDLRHHMFYGALYHWHVMFRNHAFPHFAPHRDQNVQEEFYLQVMRLLRRPRHMVERWWATRAIKSSAWPYHVVLLQLEHDASFRSFSRFSSQTEFIETVVRGFAEGAPDHHRLVFKAHPLEDGRAPIETAITDSAARYGVSDRVVKVRSGKLAALIASARSAITVNSTAAHQALWRGLPVRSFGTSVYDKPGLVSHQPLPEFFASPTAMDPALYAIFRQFLLETSQLPGGFYSTKARLHLLRNVIDLMLSPEDAYDKRLRQFGSVSQQLRLVR